MSELSYDRKSSERKRVGLFEVQRDVEFNDIVSVFSSPGGEISGMLHSTVPSFL